MNLKELSKYIKIGKLEKILALFFLFLLLFPFPNGADRFFWKYFFDAGHPILFFLCTLFIYKSYVPQKNKAKSRVILESAILRAWTASDRRDSRAGRAYRPGSDRGIWCPRTRLRSAFDH